MFIRPVRNCRRIRFGTPVLMWTVILGACALPASAFSYTGEVHTTVTVIDDEFWSGISVGEGQGLEYRVSVSSGMNDHRLKPVVSIRSETLRCHRLKAVVSSRMNVNVYLIDDRDLTVALSGGMVVQHRTDEGARSVSRTYSNAGKYALVITNAPYTSICKVDITVKSDSIRETGSPWILGGLAAGVIMVAIAIGAVMYRRRRATLPQYPARPARDRAPAWSCPPAQYGPPAWSYPPPPVYPSVQNRVPARAFRETAAPAPAAAPWRPESQPACQPPPAPPGYGQPGQYPAGAPQAPAGPIAPPPAPSPTVACRYCLMEVAAGLTVCPRCGGLM